MSEVTIHERGAAEAGPTGSTARWIALGLLPLALLGVVLALIVATNAGLGARQTPPIEKLSIQRVILPEPGVMQLKVVNDGPDPITIAQVTVDDAYWPFDLSGDRTLGRLESATLTVPYPWAPGEAHAVRVISSTGLTFVATVPVAVEAPRRDGATVARFALIGFYVGVVPVALGLLWFPFLRRLGARGLGFMLAVTIGLLVFLIVDMFQEAQEVALGVPASLKGPLLVPTVALLAFLLLTTVASRPGIARRGLALAYQIALGIGLHNLGEGLAIGAAFALGEVALGVFLVIGFTLHNVTEGVGIATPLLRGRPALVHFGWLALLAGGPAILGVWLGGFVYSPLWTTVFLSLGIGAIAQVIVEIGRLLGRGAAREGQPLLNWTTFGGVAAGVAFMYATALLVAA